MRRISTMFLIFVLSAVGLVQVNQIAEAETQGTQSSSIVKVTTGMRHTCALTSKGGVACWGDGPSGALGLSSLSKTASPVFLDSISDAVDVSAGTWHTCAVLKSGMVMCWGDNTSGQLGNGSTSNSWIPVEVQGLSNAVSVSAGTYHTCALTSAGKVFCWGSDTRGYGTSNTGQLGNGAPFQDSSYPSEVQGLAGPAIQISSSEAHSCAVLVSKQLQCWGKSIWGELGNGGFSNSPSPVFVSNFSSKEVMQVSTSFENTCALLGGANAGDAYCWGFQTWGVHGNESPLIGGYVGSAVPVKASISGVSYLDTGGATACAIKNREVWCWGSNQQGQIQSSSLPTDGWFQARTSTPTKVALPGPVDRISISEGVQFESTSAGAVCAWSSSDVYCWGGSDATGQQGNGTFSQYAAAPQKVNFLSEGPSFATGPTISAGVFLSFEASDPLKAFAADQDKGPFGGASSEIKASARLTGDSLHFTKTSSSQVWAGNNLLHSNSTPYRYTDADKTIITMDYWSNDLAPSPVMLMLNLYGASTATKTLEAQPGYNKLSFDMSTGSGWNANTEYRYLTIFPNFGAFDYSYTGAGSVPNTGQVYEIDNISINGGTPSDIFLAPKAATSTLLTFEDADTLGAKAAGYSNGDKREGAFGGAVTSITEAPSGGNGGKALKIEKQTYAETWAGVNILDLDSSQRITDSTHVNVTFNYYSPKANSPVRVEIAGYPRALGKEIHTPLGWSRVTVNFADVPTWSAEESYSELVIFPDFAQSAGAVSQAYFVDDVAFNGATTPLLKVVTQTPSLLVNFESSDTSGYASEDANGVRSKVVSDVPFGGSLGSKSALQVQSNDSCIAGTRFLDAGAGASLSSQVVEANIYSPFAGKQITLRLEDGNGEYIESSVISADGWWTYKFEFAPSENIGYRFASIIFDFDCDQTANYYLDDVAFNGAQRALIYFESPSDDATAEITINGQSVSDGDTISVHHGTERVSVTVATNHPLATYIVFGEGPLESGSNVLTVDVMADDGKTILAYKFNIYVGLNSDTTAKFFIDNNPVQVGGVYRHSASVSLIPDVTVDVEPTDHDATWDILGGADLICGVNEVYVTVTAADGVTSTIYTLLVDNQVDCTLSSDSSISAIRVNGKIWKTGTVIEVEAGDIDLQVLTNNEFATVTVAGVLEGASGIQDLVVRVTSQDGLESTVETVTVWASEDMGLSSMSPTQDALRVGSLVRFDSGLLTEHPRYKASFTWMRDGEKIEGHIGRTYLPTAADVGHNLRLLVTLTREGYPTKTHLSKSVPIQLGQIENAPATSLKGTAVVGRTLYLVPRNWPSGTLLNYQWFRNGIALAGQTSTVYRISHEDANSALSLRVTGSRPGFESLEKVSPNYIVNPGVLKYSVKPRMQGRGTVGTTITVDPGLWPTFANVKLVWMRNGIAFRTSSSAERTYTLTSEDYQQRLSVQVVAEALGHTNSVIVLSQLVKAGTWQGSSAVKVSGVAEVGKSVSASFAGYPTGTLVQYSWYRDRTSIKGAAGSSYEISERDVGRGISVKVNVSVPGYKTFISLSPTVAATK